MTGDSAFAVALRKAKWDLDELAFNLPTGRATPDQLLDLAKQLERVAVYLRTLAAQQQNKS